MEMREGGNYFLFLRVFVLSCRWRAHFGVCEPVPSFSVFFFFCMNIVVINLKLYFLRFLENIQCTEMWNVAKFRLVQQNP